MTQRLSYSPEIPEYRHITFSKTIPTVSYVGKYIAVYVFSKLFKIMFIVISRVAATNQLIRQSLI